MCRALYAAVCSILYYTYRPTPLHCTELISICMCIANRLLYYRVRSSIYPSFSFSLSQSCYRIPLKLTIRGINASIVRGRINTCNNYDITVMMTTGPTIIRVIGAGGCGHARVLAFSVAPSTLSACSLCVLLHRWRWRITYVSVTQLDPCFLRYSAIIEYCR